ncbi:MAG: pyridoxine 5'-phosphate synthase [bacterium]|nr:pyridoxine 5'-phosphate synthase [bacterium]
MTLLSVNVNKIALLRNSRGENNPDLLKMATKIVSYGAHGITVHPRPDGRHITYHDVHQLKEHLSVELNVEGYPSVDFMNLVLAVKPAQVTLVPDPPGALTSSFGWDIAANADTLQRVITPLKDAGIRSSIFIDPDFTDFESLTRLAPDRVELYTYDFARQFAINAESSVQTYAKTAQGIHDTGVEINAGHDLNQRNLHFFLTHVPYIQEVSIGHALICESLEDGLEHTVKQYLKEIP